jgi:hypothetical protein
VRNKLIASATLVCSALAVATSPMTANAAEHRGQHRIQVCRDVSSRGARNTGTVVGAVAGHQIAKHNDTHRACHWEWRNNH